MKTTQRARLTTALLAVMTGWLALPQPAAAIDAGDVVDKMDARESSHFIAGAVDMASHLYAVAGNREKADCATKWLFDNEDSNREIHTFLEAHKDKDAVGLLSILIDRHCGK